MNLWRASVGLVIVACLVSTGLLLPVRADKQAAPDKEEKLEFKCFSTKDKTFYQKLKTITTQEMKVKDGGQSMKQVQDQTFIISWKPLEKKGTNYIVEQKIEYVKMQITIGTTNISYDSGLKEQPKNPMTEFFDSLMKVTLVLTIDENTMKVTGVDKNKEFVDKLGESHPQMKNLLKSILSEEAIKKMSDQTWAAIPLKAVKKGSKWEVDSELNLGPIGSYKNKYSYVLDEIDAKKAKISVTPSMDYIAPKDKAGDALPFVIKGDSSLKSVAGKETAGTVVFDREKGRIESSKMEMKVAGTVVIDIGGTDTRVELSQTQSSELTTGDELEALKK